MRIIVCERTSISCIICANFLYGSWWLENSWDFSVYRRRKLCLRCSEVEGNYQSFEYDEPFKVIIFRIWSDYFISLCCSARRASRAQVSKRRTKFPSYIKVVLLSQLSRLDLFHFLSNKSRNFNDCWPGCILPRSILPVGVSLYYLLLRKRDPHLEDR